MASVNYKTEKMYPSLENSKLSIRERLSYAMLDTSGQLIFTMISSYLLFFYTDIAGLPVSVAGVILLVARFIDGIDAPIWGTIIDRTNSKFGRVRPYFLWLAIPFSVFGILTFMAPDLSMNTKILYCAVTYIVTSIIYTGMNTPLTAILPLLTLDPSERLKLNSWRMTGSQIGVLIVNSLTLPMVAWLGQGNDVNGFRWTILIFSALSCLMTLYAFTQIKERVSVTDQKVTLRQGMRAMNKNWPWFIIVISNLFFWIALTGRTSTLVYYFTYNIENKNLVTILNSIASIQIFGMIAIPFINKYMSKRNLWIAALVAAIIGQVIILSAGTYLPIIIIGWIIANLGSGIACSMPFALLGSAVDYGKWKNGVSASGLLTSVGSSFCLKVGSGIAAFVPSVIMASFGYVANQSQTFRSLMGISISFNWVTIVAFALALIPVLFYKKYEKNGR
ncbi:MFS transporter [Paenibacillus polymyxa]|uniref:MFS transporter n=1 Tax=Paenibacillus polymyxa TaxID=1406 RepID=UPI0025B70E71|nr:MFS transporter [Paenibacillus polymyxa]MDN4080071.1 MFS transporter [Paenibacillus polymyxa]MDN4105107.1 MFS transporter [Paenibacillus polymyxa]MDN4115393.1 MFS transporter [Paenibacillus polymyxa]